MDGFMSQYSSVIIKVVGFVTTALVTEIFTPVGAKNAPDYANSDVMRKVFIIWAIMGIACGVLAMIPYFFWDLTEKKQLQISQDLKKRALQSDLDAGDLAQDQVAEAIALGILTSEAAMDMGFSLEDIQQPQSVTEQIDAVVQADTVADDGAQPNSDSSDKE